MFVYDEEGADARQARRRRRQRRVLRPRRRRGGPPAVGPHRPRPGLPRRPAAAARGAARPAGPVAGQHPLLLRHPRPHLGAAGAHQGPPRRRRPGPGPASSSQAIEPFVYRKYLSFAEINEIKALKRRIEQQGRARPASSDTRGQDRPRRHPRHRVHHPVPAAAQRRRPARACASATPCWPCDALESAGCLTDQEYRVLDDAYRFLRKTEHRLQLLFDLQTHRLPDGDGRAAQAGPAHGLSPPERRPPRGSRRGRRGARGPRLGRRRGRRRRAGRRRRRPPADPLDAFLHDYRDKTEPTAAHPRPPAAPDVRRRGRRGRAGVRPDPRPQPRPRDVRAVLGRYRFRDVPAAYQNLVQLAQESVPFLSTRRCRHFLASIAPRLLRAVADTPDPDMALVNLEKVTTSLGAKTVLWELFSFNPPSLKLYVDLCAWSQFLSEILINNPGMIDELLDSLVLNQPRTRRRAARGAGRAVPRGRPTSTRSCTASRTRSCCASASATSSARTPSARPRPA